MVQLSEHILHAAEPKPPTELEMTGAERTAKRTPTAGKHRGMPRRCPASDQTGRAEIALKVEEVTRGKRHRVQIINRQPWWSLASSRQGPRNAIQVIPVLQALRNLNCASLPFPDDNDVCSKVEMTARGLRRDMRATEHQRDVGEGLAELLAELACPSDRHGQE